MASGTIYIDDYDVYLRQILGRGAFGVVYKGKNRNNDKQIAVKNITYKEAGEESNETLKIMGTNELDIFHLLNNHKNIVQLLHQHDDGEAIWMFMEYCDLRDLPYYLKSTIPELDQKLKIMYESISAISYMHSFSPPIIHRDIKPQNVLMMTVKDTHVVKLTDFGIGKLLESSSGALQATMTTLAGTASYMAPEFSTGGYLRYKPSVDVFSLGLLFHILLQYDRSNNSLLPMSTEVVKSNKMCNFGQEMSYADQNNLPLPKLFETPPADSNSTVREVQHIITDMVKYHESERLKPVLVKDKIMEVYSAHMQRKVSELEEKHIQRPLSEKMSEDLHNTVADLREDHTRLQQELLTKEKSYQNIIKENEHVIEKLREDVAEARNVIDMSLKEQDNQEICSKRTPKQFAAGFFSKVFRTGQPREKVKENVETGRNTWFQDLEENKDIKVVYRISQRHFGEIWLANINVQEKTVPRMLKIIMQEFYKQNFKKTAAFIRKLKHERIMQIIDVYTYSDAIYVITEVMINGNLLNYLQYNKRRGTRIKLDVIIDMASQIAEGMDYLAENCCIHRSLKAINIFLGENNIIKIGNFFSAIFINDKSEVYIETDKRFMAQLRWTAPEVLLQKKYSIKSDVWSYGILLYEAFTYGKIPYPGLNDSEFLARLKEGYRMPRPSTVGLVCPQSIYDEVLLKCWEAKPEDRPSFSFLGVFFRDYVVE